MLLSLAAVLPVIYGLKRAGESGVDIWPPTTNSGTGCAASCWDRWRWLAERGIVCATMVPSPSQVRLWFTAAGGSLVALVNAGLEGFVRNAAAELPRGLRINLISSGWVQETLESMGVECVEAGISGSSLAAAQQRRLGGPAIPADSAVQPSN